jgi:hypothetical protein
VLKRTNSTRGEVTRIKYPEVGGGADEAAPNRGESEDAGLGNAAGAPWSPGLSGLQPIDRIERHGDDGRAQNVEGAEAPSIKNVLTPV